MTAGPYSSSLAVFVCYLWRFVCLKWTDLLYPDGSLAQIQEEGRQLRAWEGERRWSTGKIWMVFLVLSPSKSVTTSVSIGTLQYCKIWWQPRYKVLLNGTHSIMKFCSILWITEIRIEDCQLSTKVTEAVNYSLEDSEAILSANSSARQLIWEIRASLHIA